MTSTKLQGRHIVFFSWRDTTNPEGGGAELYLEQMAQGLVREGARVTVFCAEHGDTTGTHWRDGVRFVHRGSKMSIYLLGPLLLLLRRFGRVDLVVDVQNGLPFFTRLATRKPVVVLIHHVHREQWPVVYPGWFGRFGWWIESRLAPRLYRGSQYVAVSRATRNELVALGVAADQIAVVHNGNTPPPPTLVQKSPTPMICVVGRIVPHKQVEHAIDAWAALHDRFPELRLVIVGAGWWEDEIRAHARSVDRAGTGIELLGHVDETRKHEVYRAAWLMALPSLKEGWGLVVGEAGAHATPTVAYRAAGGTQESIRDGVSGRLVDNQEELVETIATLLDDAGLRHRLAAGALEMSEQFTWAAATQSFAEVLDAALAGRRLAAEDIAAISSPFGLRRTS